ncbi:MAG: DUF1007 family protein [Pseudomonadota bacterium]
MKRALGTIFLGVALLWPQAETQSHPHVWVTGGADFGLDEQGRLARLHVTWIYDEFASLYMVNYLNVDQDKDQVFTDEDKAIVLADQTTWPEDFEGDSYLYVDGRKRALGGPQDADTRILETGQVEVTFVREVKEPFRPGADGPEAVVKVYDPVFYYAYELEEPAKIIGDSSGCTSQIRRVDPDDQDLAALRVQLSALGRDETPDMPDVGALFADDLVLTCE